MHLLASLIDVFQASKNGLQIFGSGRRVPLQVDFNCLQCGQVICAEQVCIIDRVVHGLLRPLKLAYYMHGFVCLNQNLGLFCVLGIQCFRVLGESLN